MKLTANLKLGRKTNNVSAIEAHIALINYGR
jgi:hypothetical protein